MNDAPPPLPRLLQDLDPKTADQVLRYAHHERFERGQTILMEGDTPSALYFVEQGLTRLVQISAEGRIFVLNYVGPGDCINLTSAIKGHALVATVEAVTDALMSVIPGEHWRGLLGDNAQICHATLQQLAEDLRAMTIMVRELALHPVAARLARFILEHTDDTGPATRWTQESIAASIGSVRDVVGRELRALIEEGVLRRDRGELMIVDRDELERIARAES